MGEIVILTPTYNRANTLPRLYESLVRQTKRNFHWLIVDDGSSDNTKEFVEKIMKISEISIQYIYQPNGGKVRALNNGFSHCTTSNVVMIVDSDDYLLPDAVENVVNYFEEYRESSEIGGFFFHYKTTAGKLIKPKGESIKFDEIMTVYEYHRYYGKHDGCICYLKSALEEYRYPEFENEKYVGPTVMQMEMAEKYKIVYSPVVIGVAEYQEGGLTKSGRKLRLKNPLGMMHYCKLMMSRKSSFFTQIKYAISIWPYAKIAKKSPIDILRMVKRPFLLIVTFIPGQILSKYWLKKYR